MQSKIGATRTLLPRPLIPDSIADRVTVSGLKWVLDGTPIERSAALRKPYTDDARSSGRLNFPRDEILAMLTEARQQDQQSILHVVGDETARAVPEAQEASGGSSSWAARRLRLEHGDGLSSDLLPRAKGLGIVVVQNPTHLTADDLFARRFGPDRSNVFQPLCGLLTAGIPLVLASDGPPSPYLNLMLATTYARHPAEALTREEAVIAYTRTAAFAEFAEKDKGTLEPGMLADLAVLSQNIFEVPSTGATGDRRVVDDGWRDGDLSAQRAVRGVTDRRKCRCRRSTAGSSEIRRVAAASSGARSVALVRSVIGTTLLSWMWREDATTSVADDGSFVAIRSIDSTYNRHPSMMFQ